VGKKKEKEKDPSTKNIAKPEEQCGQQQQAKKLWHMSLKTTCACSKAVGTRIWDVKYAER
jgi:hypothetical protein